MGRSAKMTKRPTKAEKLSRQVNAPISNLNRSQRPRSLSPDLAPASTSSSIPLFNTSRKGALVPPRPPTGTGTGTGTATATVTTSTTNHTEPDLEESNMNLDLSLPSSTTIDLVSSLTSTTTISTTNNNNNNSSTADQSHSHWSSEFPLSKRQRKFSTTSSSSSDKLKKVQRSISNDARKLDRKITTGRGSGVGGGGKGSKGGKDKFQLGVDYVTLHEKRNGGERFSKKLR